MEGTILTWLYIFKKYIISGGFYLLLSGSLLGLWVGGKFRWLGGL